MLPPRAPRARAALLAAALLATAVVAGAPDHTLVARAAATQSARPNVVVFMADDMRYDDLVFMPKLRKLVGRTGIEFENSFSPYPLCCPARASFLTGRAAHNHHVYWHDAPYGFGAFDDSDTIATAMSRAGYRTGFLGKYLNGFGTQRSRVTGEKSIHYVPRGWDQWRAAVERPKGASWRGGTYQFFNTAYSVNGHVDAHHKGEYSTNTIAEMTRDMVDDFHRSPKPFFVFASFVAPHSGGPRESDDPRKIRRDDGAVSKMRTTARPRWVRGKFDDVIKRAAGLPRNGGPSEADVTDKPHGKFRAPEVNAPEREALKEITRQRAEALYVLDVEVGKTIAHLKDIGEWSNTVFMFTSDNGYYLGEHRQRTGKVNAHEPSLRTPTLVTGPGVERHGHRYDPVTTMDLTATIADIGHATDDFPFPLDGVSQWPTIRDGDRGWTRPVVTESLYGAVDGTILPWQVTGFPAFGEARGAIGIRLGRYKITVFHDGFVELYDLATDPNEMDGVQDDPAYRDVEAAMLDLWWRYKDCRGAACTAPVPAALTTGPEETRELTRHMVAARIARYGR